MDIYLTADGERLRIPLLPDRINVKSASTPVAFQIIKKGEYKIPRGTALTGYSWNGVFPGEGMSEASFVHDWQPPVRIIETLNRWIENNKIVHILVTETAINDDTFIESFNYEHFGVDNVSYTITLTKYRPLFVTTAPPQPKVDIPADAEDAKKEEETKEEKKKSSHKSSKTKSTKAKGGSGSKNGNKTNTSNNTSSQKLSANVPTSKLVTVSKNGSQKPSSTRGRF